MKSAELMCELLRLGTVNPESMATDVRQHALNLMMYRGSEYACAAAVMLVRASLHQNKALAY